MVSMRYEVGQPVRALMYHVHNGRVIAPGAVGTVYARAAPGSSAVAEVMIEGVRFQAWADMIEPAGYRVVVVEVPKWSPALKKMPWRVPQWARNGVAGENTRSRLKGSTARRRMLDKQAKAVLMTARTERNAALKVREDASVEGASAPAVVKKCKGRGPCRGAQRRRLVEYACYSL